MEDIFEEASHKLQSSLQLNHTGSVDSTLGNDVLQFAALMSAKKLLKRICEFQGNVFHP